ncbi:GNAT family N-acetyltransferase [Lentzea sp. JNUCC 0626]|uniref:GNAT family N-acetyltransferase n=1 Tax=Lentzea sp. JNUCC 0626 TaxID=3367513 RepID=UPI0037482187
MTNAPSSQLSPIYLRGATPAAGAALRAMLSRCTAETLRARFLAATAPTEADELVELVGDMSSTTGLELYLNAAVRNRENATVLAWHEGQVLAAGSIFPVCHGIGEIALIVEDRWQGKGIGSLMTNALAEVATLAKLDCLCAYLDVNNVRARKLITRFCPRAKFLHPEAGVVDVVIPIAALSFEVPDPPRVDSARKRS